MSESEFHAWVEPYPRDERQPGMFAPPALTQTPQIAALVLLR